MTPSVCVQVICVRKSRTARSIGRKRKFSLRSNAPILCPFNSCAEDATLQVRADARPLTMEELGSPERWKGQVGVCICSHPLPLNWATALIWSANSVVRINHDFKIELCVGPVGQFGANNSPPRPQFDGQMGESLSGAQVSSASFVRCSMATCLFQRRRL